MEGVVESKSIAMTVPLLVIVRVSSRCIWRDIPGDHSPSTEHNSSSMKAMTKPDCA